MINEIRERWAKARNGPWTFGNVAEGKRMILDYRERYVCSIQIFQTPRHMGQWEEESRIANSEAIKDAPSDVAFLLARVEELEKAHEDIESMEDAGLGIADASHVARRALEGSER